MRLRGGPPGGVVAGMFFNPGQIASGLTGIFFPPVCMQCGGLVGHGETPGALRHVCAECAARIEFVREPCCAVCGHPFYGEIADERVCGHCEGLSPVFRRGRAAVLLKGASRALVHALKYHRERHALRDIESIFRRSPRVLELARGAVLVPVPLHPRKERERGYNQAQLVAGCLAGAAGGAAAGVSVEMLLRRVVDTVTQTSLDRATRRANLQKAFALAPGARERIRAARDRGYVLVDDVFTTGSTLNACAKILRRAGARDIDVVVFGHG